MRAGATDRGVRRGPWPWVVLVALTVPALWHVVHVPSDVDPEFPHVVRPTFSPWPPAASRLAEPGDTIDRIGLYVAAAAVVLAVSGLIERCRRCRDVALWPSALGGSLAAFWYAATPGPSPYGWYGLGWRTMFDASAPGSVRLGLGLAAVGLSALVIGPLRVHRERWRAWTVPARQSGALGLLVAATILVALRQMEDPGLGPAGYWPRWAFVWGMAAGVLGLWRLRPAPVEGARRRRLARIVAALVGWTALTALGVAVTWYHRPIERLKAVTPGRIYISAMPTYRGLELAHRRLGFKTIVNLFPEEGPLSSPLHPEELRFVRDHGLRYLNSPGGAQASDAFLDTTLALAQDPDAWPILLHCHACMDRTPAWAGIYRFVVEGWSLRQVLEEIERHRGSRPKPTVTMLYNRVLEPRAPQRYAQDPTAPLLRRFAEGTVDPYYEALRYESERDRAANPEPLERVSRHEGTGRRP